MQSDKCGIYEIRCLVSRKSYVGSSCRIYRRWSDHRRALRLEKHPSPRLQQAWNKHGESNFVFSVLEECERDKLFEREQFYIDAKKRDYNSMPKVRVLTKEMLAKRLAAQRMRAALRTACPRGHAYDDVNTYVSPRGERRCKRCNAERISARYAAETDEQREARRARTAAYYAANRHRLAIQMREYAASRKAGKREYDREYRKRKG